MSDLRTLDEQLLAAIAELEVMTAQPACDLKLLSNLRYRIARAIVSRRKLVDALLLDVIAQGGEKAEIARAERERSMVVRAHYTAHVGAWAPAAVERDWQGYCEACVGLRKAVRAKVAAQKPILYPWLALAP
ncbi:hypothetical protein IAG41_03730 [Sphingomonas sp. JC676]|uniref:hypothetical protein n=1 Tax=Sphingomonas sp. JC676 TaxID=2768065 RepID=UPI0016586C5B|nr:hypothetical protein [Sphingomonas sp. JC676]MBC9031494.1 hypothetical protein [Sphingomonas sp. JC676]